MTVRSWLYVPGDRPDLLENAAGRGADALILDLEDGVAPTAKAHARRTLAAYLDERADDDVQRWVRIDPEALEQDLAAVAGRLLDGIVLAKAEPQRLEALDAGLTRAEERAGREVGATPVAALVETARGIAQVNDVAAGPRVGHLAIGEADLAAELGLQPSPDERELVPLRLQVVVASAAAGLAPPTGPVSTELADLDALRTSTRALVRLGFRSRSAIHPAQVAVINEVLTPDAEEIARARRLVTAFEEHEAAGRGVFTDDRGRMVDLAVVRAAREVLARAAAADGR